MRNKCNFLAGAEVRLDTGDRSLGVLMHYDTNERGVKVHEFAAPLVMYRLPGSDEPWMQHGYFMNRGDLARWRNGQRCAGFAQRFCDTHARSPIAWWLQIPCT